MDATDDFLNTYTFDNLGRMTRIEQEGQSGGNTVAEKRVDFAWLVDGRYDTITRYADLAGTDLVATSTYGYDDAGRLSSLVHAKGANTLADYSWTYDAHSRITRFVSPDGTTDYTYDDTHQLTEADYDFQADDSYAWDLNGNPTGTGYSVGTNNRLLSDGTYDYSHDDEGNLTLQTTIATGAYVEYAWDHRNRLTAVTFKTSGGTTTKKVEYDYDLFDRRIGKRVDDDGNGSFDRTERYVYDGEDVVLVYDGAGSLTHRYLHGPGYDQPLADEVFATGDLFWLLDDNQGTIRDMVEYDAGTDTTSIANHIEYDAFGAITATSDPNVEVFYAYTGQEYDADTGLVYYGGRWYSPAMRRFISHDPSGFAAGDTSLARYVFNGPTNFIDPEGREAVPVWQNTSSPEYEQFMLDVWLTVFGPGATLESAMASVIAAEQQQSTDTYDIPWYEMEWDGFTEGLSDGCVIVFDAITFETDAFGAMPGLNDFAEELIEDNGYDAAEAAANVASYALSAAVVLETATYLGLVDFAAVPLSEMIPTLQLDVLYWVILLQGGGRLV